MPRFRRTRAELEQAKRLDAREEAAKKSLLSGDKSSHTVERNNGTLNSVARERAALEERVEARRLGLINAANLKKAQAQFSRVTDAKVLRDAFNAMQDNEHNSVRVWLRERIEEIRTTEEREQDAAEAETKAQRETQERLDTAAGEKAAKEILDRANPILSRPMSLVDRAKMQRRMKELAQSARKVAKTVEGFDASGARKSAVAKRAAEVFEELVERLSIFTFDLDNEPTRGEMEARAQFYMAGCDPEYFAFRSPDGRRPTQEQCLLRFAVVRYYTEHGLDQFIPSLPVLPAPTHIPGPTQESLQHILFLEQQKLESSAYREDQARKRVRELERMRVEQPKEYAKLIEASRPLVFEEDPEVVYRVETATVENPKSLPRLYFPDGIVCVPGRDIVWYTPRKCYVRPPEPIGYDAWPSSGGAKMEWVQDLRGDWVKQPVEVAAGSKWTQDATGKWIETRNTATGQLRPPGMVEIVEADHQPSRGDERTEFRFGHWYTKQQVAEAEQADPTFKLPALPEDVELPTVLDSVPTLATKPETCWTRRERELLSKTGD